MLWNITLLNILLTLRICNVIQCFFHKNVHLMLGRKNIIHEKNQQWTQLFSNPLNFWNSPVQPLQSLHVFSAELWLCAKTSQHQCVCWGRPRHGFLSSPAPVHRDQCPHSQTNTRKEAATRGCSKVIDDPHMLIIIKRSVYVKRNDRKDHKFCRRHFTKP